MRTEDNLLCIPAFIPSVNYITRLKGRSGFYFQRKVPKDLQLLLKKKHWRMKAGASLAEARRFVLRALLETDAEIAEARGQITPELLQVIDERPVEGLQRTVRDQQLHGQDIYPKHSPEDAEKLLQRQLDREQGKPVGRSIDDLLQLAKRLRGHSQQRLSNGLTTAAS